jgi:hypothetical protein
MTTPMLYRSKPATIEAMHWKGGAADATPIIDWVLANGGTASWHEAHGEHQFEDGKGYPARPEAIEITTLEGVMSASVGDYIIRGTVGEFYPCKPGVFRAKYEPLLALGG